MDGYFLEQTHGEVANLGVASMRLLVSKAQTSGALAVAEFRGAEGPWTVPHILRAGPGGGALLVLWTPGGLEQMFLELGRLPAASITDPAVRAEIAKRHDAVPV